MHFVRMNIIYIYNIHGTIVLCIVLIAHVSSVLINVRLCYMVHTPWIFRLASLAPELSYGCHGYLTGWRISANMMTSSNGNKCRSKKPSKLRVTGLCAGNSSVTGEFPAQMPSNAEKFSIWWRHHAMPHHHNRSKNRQVSVNNKRMMSLKFPVCNILFIYTRKHARIHTYKHIIIYLFSIYILECTCWLWWQWPCIPPTLRSTLIWARPGELPPW